ncbi:MAG: MATE family efflux transporter [Lachnospiraceae bacterium]|nr:MATE family efflux transporter [Lachnospiraceae bacterium]
MEIKMDERKRFFKALAGLVVPIALQNLITNAVNSADVLMLGYVGQTQLAAVSLANQFQFLLMGIFFGITSGVTMLSSQYWGKKNTDAIQAVMGIAVRIGLVITAAVTAGALLIPDVLMRLYTNDQELIEIGASYLRIVGISYMTLSFSQVYISALRSMERAAKSAAISAAALLTNVALNAVLIFGLFGAPEMGVTGVAVATVIARMLELSLCLLDAFAGAGVRLRVSALCGRNPLLWKDFLKYATPALVNDCVWTFAFSTYSVILGHLNADMVAASSVAATIRDLCAVLCFALASGAAVLLGIEIGEGNLSLAKADASRSCRATLFIGILTGGVVLALRPFTGYFFTLTPRAQQYLSWMLIISAYYVVGQAMNTLLISGVFRAGGNSRWGMVCDIVVMWGISVPLGFLSAFVLKLPPMAVYVILCMDEAWKFLPVYRYYKSGKWLRDITRTDEEMERSAL